MPLQPELLTAALCLLVLVVAVVALARSVRRRSTRLPVLAGIAVAAAGVANLASALSPADDGRIELLRESVGAGVPDTARALAVPAGIALLLTGRYLARRHRRALDLAVGALVVLAALNVFKGLDVLTGIATGAVALVLWRSRAAFDVEPLQVRWTATLGTIAGMAVGVFGATVAALAAVTWREGLDAPAGTIVHEALVLLTMTRDTTLPMPHLLAWLPDAIGVTGIATVLLALLVLFRRPPADAAFGARARADALIERHGTDTLSGFARRTDLIPHVTADGRAAGTFRVCAGVLFVGGAPSGPADAVDELLAELRAIADHHDLRMAILGAGSELSERVCGSTRMRSMYIGDEAVVDVPDFTLEGRPMKKVRQAVGRVVRAGYTSEIVRLGDMDCATRHDVASVVTAWGEKDAHGFCMEMPLGDAASADSLAVLARDGDGRVRALVHVVPTPVGGSWSLSSTPHERGLPNGVVDFLVVRMIEGARERGLQRVSLNFAAYRQWIHEPATRFERTMGPVVKFLDRFFQIERLYRFNRKFDPTWVPRHLLYDGRTVQLKTMWAAMLVEGQIRLPSVPGAARLGVGHARVRREIGPARGPSPARFLRD
ncbi:bifunctional lysylphosphatidylglycerol flippase/synthetase MprF [Patulibacter sp.]|uniref:bifunctional lysylphosphatidylglycerol flippase/synthetase MprF n=1 Tax=Patulibacter sp. TaxID=1912859 RepID=UPI00271A8830|nr:phosphatidylglycerol lysyltransferase domain-containing protein [Patulibacter sp.]MDO9406783.1 phosphatidylglycerol lysyltransferase domain-containing protein [Patulibacter sp.]